MSVHVVGVRHHSPACAKLVDQTIRALVPRFVLIEGPSDMNDRLSELWLGHELPIALFSYRQDASGKQRGSWAPFCAYSPEWIALRVAREVGAEARFIDLPAWHPAFEGEENRYSDRHFRQSDRLGEMCQQLGFENTDALWDHLFELPQTTEDLARRLESYFEQLRGDERAGERDGPREAFMAEWIAWARREAGAAEVVVVCGGYHKTALERLSSMDMERLGEPSSDPPRATASEGARVGSYLVPFSFRRLDAFAGYASGMPSPAFYQAVWDGGAKEAGETMLFRAIQHLRAKRQKVSPADAIAASTLAEGLCRLRGHAALARSDVLDGLAGALLKEALDTPLPWTRRGALLPRTHPMVREMVAAFSGQGFGSLARGTPQPPLLDDAFAELERVELVPTREKRSVEIHLTTEPGVRQSAVLHRLRLLQIPGFVRTRAPSLSRAKTELSESWTIERKLETDPALIEAALFGATLESAATAKIEERMSGAEDVAAVADALVDAAFCGIHALTGRALTDVAQRIAVEPSFGVLGRALGRVLELHRGDRVLGAGPRIAVHEVLLACLDRGLWLLEGLRGPAVPLDEAQVRAVRALRDTYRLWRDGLDVDRERSRAVCERCAREVEAPPALRGAALGFLWSTEVDGPSVVTRADDPGDLSHGTRPDPSDEARAIATLRAVARPTTFGDFLGGLFALAREEVVHAKKLLATIDACVAGLLREDFLLALPALRQAFAYFPPRERLTIAQAVLEIGGDSGGNPMSLLSARTDAELVRRGAALDGEAAALALRFGLGDSLDANPKTEGSDAP